MQTSEILIQTFLWALMATGVAMIPGVPLAYVLARFQFPGHSFLTTLTSLPMVLPPTAVGYILLRLLADSGPFGKSGLQILFSPAAVVIACSVMASPLIIRTARVAFEAVDPRLEQIARTLGYSPTKAFLSVTLPLASRGLIAAAILGITRSLGEFGATVTIAGNIPGRTQTLASAIYSAQQAGDQDEANWLLGVALAVGFTAVYASEHLSRLPVSHRKNSE